MLKAYMEVWFASPQAGMLSLSLTGLVGVGLLWKLHGSRKPIEAAQPAAGLASSK
ncbi:hypothetical protein [Azotobacter chroococcum]|uniref:hypothetical protein n=1 Tax=Azotobacter chroococcum TaxID=353 RepID=UPI0013F14EDD|nr:hypothetical protein [Azotobacter chroococcum]